MSTFLEIATEIGELVEQKNAAYGSSFAKAGEFLRLLYPKGIAPEQYEDLLLIARCFDKLMRIATAKDALGESPWSDLCGYAILGTHLHHQQKEQHASCPEPASVRVAESLSQNYRPASVESDIRATTTTSERPVSETSPQPPSRRPGNFFAGLALANAQTVMAPAAPSAVDPRSRFVGKWILRNMSGRCASCSIFLRDQIFFHLVDQRTIKTCSVDCYSKIEAAL